LRLLLHYFIVSLLFSQGLPEEAQIHVFQQMPRQALIIRKHAHRLTTGRVCRWTSLKLRCFVYVGRRNKLIIRKVKQELDAFLITPYQICLLLFLVQLAGLS
jgi:hypothetical protein